MNIWERLVFALTKRQPPVGGTRYVYFSPTGEKIDHDTALTYSAVWAATRVITEAIGSLGYHIYQQRGDGGRDRRDDLPLAYLLHTRPNPEMTAQTLKEVLTQHCLLWGNGYAEIEWDLGNRPRALWPLTPDRVTPKRDEAGTLYYEYRTKEGVYALASEDVLHIKGMGFDGTQGYDVISYMSNSFGGGIAASQYANAFFKNGAHLSGGLFHPKRLGKEGRANVREAFNEQFVGASKSHGWAIFEEGMDWKTWSATPEASQLIETRKFSITDIARIFKVPPHMIADLEHATFTNIEHQSIDFVIHTILPWCIRWEQEVDFKLLGRVLARDHYTRLNVNSLMRGDMQSRYAAYAIGRQWGWLSADDIRELEDMNPIPGDAGSRYLHPMNMADADNIPDPNKKVEAPAPEEPSSDQVEQARKARAAWRK